MPKISELATGTVTSAGKIAVAQGSTTIQASVADIGAAAGGGGLSWAVVNQKSYPMSIVGSSNVSSITDVGKGICEVNLSPAFNNADYGIGAILTYETIFHSHEVKLQATTASKFRVANHVNTSYEDALFRVVFGK